MKEQVYLFKLDATRATSAEGGLPACIMGLWITGQCPSQLQLDSIDYGRPASDLNPGQCSRCEGQGNLL